MKTKPSLAFKIMQFLAGKSFKDTLQTKGINPDDFQTEVQTANKITKELDDLTDKTLKKLKQSGLVKSDGTIDRTLQRKMIDDI